MAVIFVAVIWGSYALIRTLREARARRQAARIYFERQHQLALQAARAEALREEYRQQRLEASRETARRIAADRARMEQERRERREQELRAKEAQRAEQEARKERKAAFEREQAEAALDHLETIRSGYMDLYDTLEAELAEKTTTPKRRIAVQRQLLTIEEKLYKLDQRRAKAYYMKGAC